MTSHSQKKILARFQGGSDFVFLQHLNNFLILYFPDVEAFQSDVEKWNEGTCEWRCDNWNDEDLEEPLDLSQGIVVQGEDGSELLLLDEEAAAALVSSGALQAQHLEILTRDQGTNTECVFVKTKSSKQPEPVLSKGIVIKRSQTFSPSAVANKQEYICRVCE